MQTNVTDCNVFYFTAVSLIKKKSLNVKIIQLLLPISNLLSWWGFICGIWSVQVGKVTVTCCWNVLFTFLRTKGLNSSTVAQTQVFLCNVTLNRPNTRYTLFFCHALDWPVTKLTVQTVAQMVSLCIELTCIIPHGLNNWVWILKKVSQSLTLLHLVSDYSTKHDISQSMHHYSALLSANCLFALLRYIIHM